MRPPGGAGAALALGLIAAGSAAMPAAAETVRVATFSPELTRKGPGLLLRDIMSGKDPQVAAAVRVIAAADADVLVLTGFDWDHDGAALKAFSTLLDMGGASYPHRFAARPNSGMATGLDLDGDGRTGTADDAQGFGFFSGAGGMAVLSRLPLGEVTDHSATLWRDMPGNLMPETPTDIADIQRLSSTAHWDVPVRMGDDTLHLLAFSATPPVFDDAATDRNGRRNHDEIAFWARHLPDAPFVILGDFNLDPVDGDGRREAWDVLAPLVRDLAPASEGGRAAPQDGANSVHKGDPALDTARFAAADGPGNLRVDHILPGKDVATTGAGVLWPAPGDPLSAAVAAASRHRLVWADVSLP